MLHIKNFIIKVIVTILYIIGMLIGLSIRAILSIFIILVVLIQFIKNRSLNIKDIVINRNINNIKINITIKIKVIKNKLINIIKNLKIFIVDNYNKIKSLIQNRLNQDCFGKRLIIKIQLILNRIKVNSNFQFRRDILPLFLLISGKIYFLGIIYITILDLINLYS